MPALRSYSRLVLAVVFGAVGLLGLAGVLSSLHQPAPDYVAAALCGAFGVAGIRAAALAWRE